MDMVAGRLPSTVVILVTIAVRVLIRYLRGRLPSLLASRLTHKAGNIDSRVIESACKEAFMVADQGLEEHAREAQK